ncbi:protein NEL-like [Pecten maximus]|uniref:protein NEL-like n=1 Tax=Pecten maximus TaxID=6579 RepID=UPI001458F7FA|nr:protein NEL-like [Pecten maximus]
MVTLNVAPGTSTIPILEFGFIAVATDNEDCQGKDGVTIELQKGGELSISSGNFPSDYDNDLDCTFTVIPKNGRALSLNVVYMLTEDFECPRADPVILTFDNEDPDARCGRGFHQVERHNILSRVVVNFHADNIIPDIGWLMYFNETDENECQSGNNNCSQNADCTNIEDSFLCECKDGFSGDGVICVDINECQNGNNDCSENADCTNTEGSFSCECKEGFLGDGVTCEDPCDPNPCQGKKRRTRCNICSRDACNNCKRWSQSRNRYCKPCCNRHNGKCRKIGKRGKRKCRRFFCST